MLPLSAETDKSISTVGIVFLNAKTPAVSSLDVGTHFEKRHDNLLREIDRICTQLPENFVKLNFEEAEREVNTHFGKRKQRHYLLTRDAFSLLVMGMTGKTAMMWKIRYIEAFNALEKTVVENSTALAREAGYTQGRDEALALPAVEKERKEAYLKGMAEGKRLQIKRDGLNLLARILNYRARGLTQGETARILGISQQRVSDLLARARKLGLVPNRPARPVQGNLLEVGA